MEELEDDDDIDNPHLSAALESIHQSGESIVQHIDQMFAAHNFALEDLFSQLNVRPRRSKAIQMNF